MPHSGNEPWAARLTTTTNNGARQRHEGSAQPTREDEMATKKTRKLQNDVMDSAHKIWLAGLGALAVRRFR